MKNLIILIIICFVVSCSKTTVKESEKYLIGKYEQVSGASWEVIHLNGDYSLTSTYSTRYYKWQKFRENGSWKTSSDTLIIFRKRHDSLSKDGYPETQYFKVREDSLIEIEYNYKGELFLTNFGFQKK